jgi:hypothetical protein
MDIMELARANQDIYTTGYRAGQHSATAIINRLCGAIENYLDGETQGNVTGLREALKKAEDFEAMRSRVSGEIADEEAQRRGLTSNR